MRLNPRLGGALVTTGLLAASTVTPTAVAATDEDQVVAVLNGMNVSYNRTDFTGFAAFLCADMRQAQGFEAGWYASRRSDGPTRITVNSVSVHGDPPSEAVANVRFEAEDHDKTLDVDLVRENAGWKACRYHSGQTV